jgi:hypothetical protein
VRDNVLISAQVEVSQTLNMVIDPTYGDKSGLRFRVLDILILGESEPDATAAAAPLPLPPPPAVSPKRLAAAARLAEGSGRVKAFKLE